MPVGQEIDPRSGSQRNGSQVRGGKRLGVFTQVPGRPGQPIREVYAELLDAIVAADELGIDTFWVGQHHVDPLVGRLPSPLPFLAVAAERTRRIRLGTAVVTIGLEDPLRLAEDVAVVDALSGGRLEIGIGAGGGSGPAHEAFGASNEIEDRRRRADRHLDRFLEAVEGRALASAHSGLVLEPPAAQSLRERIWLATGSVERARIAGARGIHLLVGTFSDTQQEMLDKILAHREAWDSAGHDPERRRVSSGRFVYTGSSKSVVQAEVRDGFASRKKVLLEHRPELAKLSLADYLDRVVRYGTVPEVIAQLRADIALGDEVTDLHALLSLAPAAGPVTPGAEVDINRIREFATVNAPAL